MCAKNEATNCKISFSTSPNLHFGYARTLVRTRQPLESSLSRTSLSRILGHAECEKVYDGSGDHLERCFLDIDTVAFWIVQNAYLVPGNPSNHCFLHFDKVVFGIWQKAKMFAQCPASPFNIVSQTSPKSHFPWPENKKCLVTARQTIETSLSRPR